MKLLKTYGVFGMVEKYAVLRYNGAVLHVDFTGGSATINGVVPAKYRTDNAFIQAVIENTNEFKSGAIKLLKAVPLLTEEDKKKAAEKGGKTAQEGESIVEMTEVYVPNIESDGKKYLIENFGMKANDLRSKSSIIKEAQKAGVIFTTTKKE